MNPHDPRDAQQIVTAYLKLVEAQAAEDVYPGRLRDLPYPKEAIRTAFRTSMLALIGSGQLTPDLRDYLEVGYVSLADYVEEEFAILLQEYVRAGQELAADGRPTKERTATDAWQRVSEQSRLASQIAKSISTDADDLRAEFQSWEVLSR